LLVSEAEAAQTGAFSSSLPVAASPTAHSWSARSNNNNNPVQFLCIYLRANLIDKRKIRELARERRQSKTTKCYKQNKNWRISIVIIILIIPVESKAFLRVRKAK
jgi:hypothetical protein